MLTCSNIRISTGTQHPCVNVFVLLHYLLTLWETSICMTTTHSLLHTGAYQNHVEISIDSRLERAANRFPRSGILLD